MTPSAHRGRGGHPRWHRPGRPAAGPGALPGARERHRRSRLRRHAAGRAVDPHRRLRREQAEAALHAAAAEDVYDILPGGWQGVLDERGRLSGGQRQRLVLTRALAADPPVLVLVEPTSAVDAHTEARIADRLPRTGAAARRW
ncbi:ATP-binding cassette domain-containing protein [Serinicoccus marinus]|uniref:ATP-binding cassette domain-containing protein n=1 Tax=Serinicoccus marinus TaxID=247333 RepID=UPI001EE8D24D|nr:ATP-binding cassette domain-containing protein [Serinicoccus marinus]